MTDAQRVIRYLRDCHEADNRGAVIFDLKHPKVRHFHWLNHGGEFLSGNLNSIPIGQKIANAANREALVYKGEKTLILGAFMLVGNIPSEQRMSDRLLAPLVFYPATIRDDEISAFIDVDLQGQRINTGVLEELCSLTDADNGLVDELVRRFPVPPFGPVQLETIISLLAELLPSIDTGELIHFPKPLPVRRVNEFRNSVSDEAHFHVRCIPNAAMALIPKSRGARGVLVDLKEMAESKSHSAPIRNLFTPDPPIDQPDRGPILTPAILSAAQKQIFQSVHRNPLTVMIGPPGTGKSYTVAALALDQVVHGKSVLIASKGDQALDVIADKIRSLSGEDFPILRGGRAGHKKELKDYLKQLLSGMNRLQGDLMPAKERDALRNWIEQHERSIRKIEANLDVRSVLEQDWGTTHLGKLESEGFGRLKHALKHWWVTQKIEKRPDYGSAISHYFASLHDHNEALTTWLRAYLQHRLNDALTTNRRQLVALNKAVRSRTQKNQERWFPAEDTPLILNVFPVWMVNLSDANDLLPLYQEMFDLVIIDEATQCDISSCLPVFQRAKKAVITGDPKQLRHISFLSRDRQSHFGRHWKLSEEHVETFHYRDKSVLDLLTERAASQEQVIMLDEHYRSRPGIIRFSNKHFYDRRLKIMTERPRADEVPPLIVHETGGQRNAKGVNETEASLLIDDVFELIQREEHLPENLCHSIGILSPFRDQVDHLFELLSQRVAIGAIEKHQIRIGTPHAFQGDERDVMFLSFALDDLSHSASFRYLEKPDVFNVSITRARNLQHVYASIGTASAGKASLLEAYLDPSNEPSPSPGDSDEDRFLNEVGAALTEKGFHTWPSYGMAGLTMDLVVEKFGAPLAIDLVGCPGPFADSLDLEKYRMLERAGLWVFPLAWSAWHKDPQDCLKQIETWIQGER